MRRVLTASVLFTLTIFLRWAAAEETVLRGPQFTVSVYNDAGVPPTVLDRAEQRARSIFARADLDVVWVNCPQASTEDALACNRTDVSGYIALRIIPNAISSTSHAVFGVAFLSPDGAGKYSDVFWKRAEDLHETSNLDLGSILGSVMAHELGHLLLGSNAHALSGIMRAHWEGEELRRIAMGTLLFTPRQAKLMRGKARLLESAEQSMQRNPPSS
jgi:hypothetical protein